MVLIHLNGTHKAPIYRAEAETPDGEKEGRAVAAETIILQRVDLHSHDHAAGAHVQSANILFEYQYADGRKNPN